MSFKKTFLKNIFTLGGYNYTSQIANFLATIVLSRLLLPEEYGYVALITVFTGFITIFADAGLSFSIIRSDYGRTFHKAMSNLSFYIGVLLFSVMLILAYPIALFYEDTSLVLPIIILSSNYILSGLRIAPMAVINRNLDFNYFGKVRLWSNIISIVLMIFLAFIGFSYWALILPQLILNLVQYIYFAKRVDLRFKFYRFSYTRAAFRKSKSIISHLSGFNLINYWAANTDNLMVGKFYSSYDLGIYDRAYKILRLSLNLVSGLFGTVLYPSLNKLKNDGGNINKEYLTILGIISIINFPLIAIMVMIPTTIVDILWGENWILVADYLPYFGVFMLFQTLMVNNGQFYLLLKKERTFMLVGVFGDIIRVVATVVGAFFSVEGIIIARLLVYVLINMPIHLYVGFYRTFKFSSGVIFKFWVPKIVAGILLFLGIYLQEQILSGIVIFVYFVHLIFYQREDLHSFLTLIKSRLTKNHE
jgi:O-antigen/teichoic acid export membrane protein